MAHDNVLYSVSTRRYACDAHADELGRKVSHLPGIDYRAAIPTVASAPATGTSRPPVALRITKSVGTSCLSNSRIPTSLLAIEKPVLERLVLFSALENHGSRGVHTTAPASTTRASIPRRGRARGLLVAVPFLRAPVAWRRKRLRPARNYCFLQSVSDEYRLCGGSGRTMARTGLRMMPTFP